MLTICGVCFVGFAVGVPQALASALAVGGAAQCIHRSCLRLPCARLTRTHYVNMENLLLSSAYVPPSYMEGVAVVTLETLPAIIAFASLRPSYYGPLLRALIQNRYQSRVHHAYPNTRSPYAGLLVTEQALSKANSIQLIRLPINANLSKSFVCNSTHSRWTRLFD